MYIDKTVMLDGVISSCQKMQCLLPRILDNQRNNSYRKSSYNCIACNLYLNIWSENPEELIPLIPACFLSRTEVLTKDDKKDKLREAAPRRYLEADHHLREGKSDLRRFAEANPQTSIDEASEESFKASRGWFENFKKSTGIHSVVRHGEAASSDMKAAEDYIKTFSDLIKAQGYISQQVLNCDDTGLFWKKMPNRTYITAEEKKMPGYKPMKDRLTLALCANASSDCKIKPLLVYHSENPRALKSHKILKEKLQVMWRSNPKARVTRKFFVERVNLVFSPSVKKYLQGKKPTRASPSHPRQGPCSSTKPRR
ncbi:tigger transposable element-derived protein 1 [Nephila pilipes]|uniref:Tigger transposable element-derived protein 1 n=1 Tax=Nephila pilipes TaxID=299642 RepID=A0A8X6UB00_NEPPI|nr:tigger transposable element-derived protein 1 [Nephila pilipes]